MVKSIFKQLLTLLLVCFTHSAMALSKEDNLAYKAHLQSGDEQMETKNFVDALKEYTKASLINKDDASLLLMIAVCYEKLENKPKALEYYEKAYWKNPDNEKLPAKLKELNSKLDLKAPQLLKAVLASEKTDDHATITRLFTEYLKLYPDDYKTCYRFASYLEQQENPAAALTYYRSAAKTNPNYQDLDSKIAALEPPKPAVTTTTTSVATTSTTSSVKAVVAKKVPAAKIIEIITTTSQLPEKDKAIDDKLSKKNAIETVKTDIALLQGAISAFDDNNNTDKALAIDSTAAMPELPKSSTAVTAEPKKEPPTESHTFAKYKKDIMQLFSNITDSPFLLMSTFIFLGCGLLVIIIIFFQSRQSSHYSYLEDILEQESKNNNAEQAKSNRIKATKKTPASNKKTHAATARSKPKTAVAQPVASSKEDLIEDNTELDFLIDMIDEETAPELSIANQPTPRANKPKKSKQKKPKPLPEPETDSATLPPQPNQPEPVPAKATLVDTQQPQEPLEPPTPNQTYGFRTLFEEVEHEHKSGIMSVKIGNKQGIITFIDGLIETINFDNHQSIEVLFTILKSPELKFSFLECKPNVSRSLAKHPLEVLKLLDIEDDDLLL